MLFECPNCAKRYDLSKIKLPASGRKVRCAQCSNDWMVKPEDAITLSPPLAKPSQKPAPKAAAVVSKEISVEDEMLAGWGAELDEAPDDTPNDQGGVDALFDAPMPNANEENDQGGIDALFDMPDEENSQDDIDNMFGGASEENDQGGIDALFDAPEPEDTKAAIGDPGDMQPVEEASFEELSLTSEGVVSNEEAPRGTKAETLRDAESMARRTAIRTKVKQQRSKSSSVKRFIQIASCVALAVTFGQLREPIVRIAPFTAPIYQALGLDVNLIGFDFADVRFQRTVENGIEVLTIKGQIYNSSEKGRVVPSIRFALFDDLKTPVYQWSKQFEEPMLGAGQSLDFETRLTSPPPSAVDIEMKFGPRRTIRTSSLD
jgi:predicted Zn finger-like uncharacterized protein